MFCVAIAMSKAKVAVIGAGVIGLSVGVRLLESRDELEVTIVAEKFHPNITSNGAGGFVYPDAASEDERVLATMRYLRELQSSGLAEEAGVSLVPTFLYFSTPQERPWWAGAVAEFEMLTRLEAAQRGLRSEPYEVVFSFRSYVVEPKKYLPWLMSKFQKLGGKFEQRRVTAMEQLAGHGLVVNCAGLGAGELTGDRALYPVRGQIVAVRVPSASPLRGRPEIHAWDPEVGEELTYVIPHSDVTLLGGCRNHGSWSQVPDAQQTDAIYGQCLRLVPALEGSEIVETWACLRPMRSGVRLEFEWASPSLPVVHCYGHGGRGYILHWGCAIKVQELVEEFLKGKGII